MGWIELILALFAFFASHGLPLRPAIRGPLQGRLGRRGFTAAYSLLSLAALAWLIPAASRAPYLELWGAGPWQGRGALVLMLVSILLAALSIGRPNPFSFGGGKGAFEAEDPGITGWIRHPLLLAILVWALAHIIANGDAAHVMVFGLFALFALAGMRQIDKRRQREWGPEEWAALRQRVRDNRGWRWLASPASLKRLMTGSAVYAAILAVHPLVFGVSPLALAAG